MAQLPPSRVASHLYPPSSTSAATVQYLKDRTLTFVSEWYFKPEGVKLVKGRFGGQLEKRSIDAFHWWDEEDQSFRICCHPGDVNRVWPLFYMVIAKIIKDEVGEEEEDDDSQADWTAADIDDQPLQSNLIERLEDYRKRTGLDETADQDDTRSHPLGAELDPSDLFPEEIKYSESKAIWPQDMDADLISTLNLEEIAPDNVIEELERLTGCQLVKVLNKRKIYIGGHSDKTCTVVLAKLDVLCKYKSMTPYQKHIFYSEGEEDFKLVLKPIIDIRKSYFETTLLDPLQLSSKCNHHTLPKASTIRIANYNHKNCLYVSTNTLKFAPAVNSEDMDRGLKDWINYTYCPTGELSQNLRDPATVTQASLFATIQNDPGPVRPAIVQQTTSREIKNASIQQWAQNISTKSACPLGLPLQGAGQPGVVAANPGTINDNENKPSWDQYKHFSDKPVLRNELKIREFSNSLAKDLSSMRIAKSSQSVEAPPPSLPQTLMPEQSIQNQRFCPFRPPSNTLELASEQASTSMISAAQPITNQVPTRSSVSSAWSVSLAEVAQASVASQSEPQATVHLRAADKKCADIETFLYKQPERSLLDDDISVLEFSGPIMQPMKWEDHTKLSAHIQRPKVESMQPLSEVETRTFHNTMNQRTPKPKSNLYSGRLPKLDPVKGAQSAANNGSVTDPRPEFVRELGESFQDLMKVSQGFRGQVQVQAEFCRILLSNVHDKHITSKGQTDTTKLSEAMEKLLDSADFTSCTKVLTTSPGEMPYLLNLSDAKGNDLWDKGSAWNVDYEFCFVERLAAHQYSRFSVVLDGESFAKQIKRYLPLGSIYVHGAARHWDFQVTVTGVENGQDLRERYGELATAVETSLHVPQGSPTPLLFFSLDEPMSKRFELAAVRVHRVCRYKSNNAKSILKISEIHSLDITSVSQQSSTYFKLSPGPLDRKSNEKPGLGHWFEASISNAQLNELLEQNENLELGEEAQWTPEGLSKLDLIKSIYLPACEMLKKMDGIGQYNNNGVDVRSGLNTTSKVTQKPKEEFW